jgi:riboflavin transporter 2
MLKTKSFLLTTFLFVLFGLSTWLDVNGVWIQLPLIVNRLPEGWTLPSYLALAGALSNIGPVILMILKLIFKQRLDERIFIYIEIFVGIVSCALIAQYWHKTTYFAGAQRSVPLIILVFLLGTLDATSTVTYSDYMKRYHPKLLNSLYLGESFTTVIPSILASMQGVGGEAICLRNSTYPEYSSPRFSVQVFFWIFVGIIFISLLAFILLEYSTIPEKYRVTRRVVVAPESSTDYELSVGTDATSSSFQLTSQISMTKQMYSSLLAVTFLSSTVLYGILPSIGTYAMLPYSQRTYYIASIVVAVCYPLAVLIGLIGRSILNTTVILALCFVATSATVYVVVVATLSPCPPLHDSIGGAILVVTLYCLSCLLFYYIRLVIGNRIRQEYKRDSGLFWLGAVGQLGSLGGAIPMYLLINIFKMFKSREACQMYC